MLTTDKTAVVSYLGRTESHAALVKSVSFGSCQLTVCVALCALLCPLVRGHAIVVIEFIAENHKELKFCKQFGRNFT